MPGPAHALRERLARGALALTRRAGRRLGQHVTVANVHSVIPEIPPESDPIWSRRSDIEVDSAGAMDFIESALGRFIPEMTGLQIWNGLYEGGDAELLYAMVRHTKPKRVLELGAGFSTMVTAAACLRNIEEGCPVEVLAVDPEPRIEVAAALRAVGRFERADARDLPVGRFEELEAGDVLFIDTSHVVKLGSEVNRLLLEVLPRLAPGVRVQVHDIFLPYEYPRHRLIASGFFNEQYLLHALLLENPGWRIELPVYAVWREQRERLAAAIPSLRSLPQREYEPSALWLRRV